MERIGTSIASRFMGLFDGLRTVYGRYVVTSTEPSGKQVGDSRSVATVRGEVTEAVWQAHLDGRQGLGIVPIRDGDDCVFGALDIDDYDINLEGLVRKVNRRNLPLIVCRTKSGGAHIYCFSENPVPAKTMRAKLTEVAAYLGHGGCEIFPKQTQILAKNGDTGSWINVPYFQAIRGMRYAVNPDGSGMSPEEFLNKAEMMKASDEWFRQLLVFTDDFKNGPPCLQILADIGCPTGTRNDGLYNMGVYLKRAIPDDWENELQRHNDRYMDPPLTRIEVDGVMKSLRKKEYHYNCSRQPIVSHCNSVICRTRKYGVGGGSDAPMPVFGGMTKLNTSPPVWFWSINDVRMELSTNEIQDMRLFQRKCMEYLNIMPGLMKMDAWLSIVNACMSNAITLEAPKEASPDAQFWEQLEKFCTGKAQAMSKKEIVLGKPYTENGHTYFRIQDLESFLVSRKTPVTRQRIIKIFKESDVEHGVMAVGASTTNYWIVPSFTKSREKLEVPKDLAGKDEVF